jgi:hypothetical protein
MFFAAQPLLVFFTNDCSLAPVVGQQAVGIHTRVVEAGRRPGVGFRQCTQAPLVLQEIVMEGVELLQHRYKEKSGAYFIFSILLLSKKKQINLRWDKDS